MKVTTYLNFTGNCEEALAFYQKVFDAPAPVIMRFHEMPPEPGFTIPEEARNWVLHAQMQVGDDWMYFSDACPGQPFNGTVGDRVFVTLEKIDVAAAARLYARLQEGGDIVMPLAETFWSPAFAMLVDKFGIKWMISAER